MSRFEVLHFILYIFEMIYKKDLREEGFGTPQLIDKGAGLYLFLLFDTIELISTKCFTIVVNVIQR